MSTLLTCLYCQARKPASDFNREHVLPAAFGRFHGNNFVLREIVCRDCNTHFGNTIDAKLARDSMEGIDRFALGLVDASKRRRIGTSIEVTMREGRFRGSLLEYEVDEGGGLRVRPRRQVGFASTKEGPFEWYELANAPSTEVLASRGLVFSQFGGVSEEEAVEFLHSRGLSISERFAEEQPEAEIGVNVRGRIDTTIRRAVAKIAFNYLAFHYLEIARLDQFDAIRRFIRYGAVGPGSFVEVVQKPMLANAPAGARLLGHMIAVRWDPSRHAVVGQVSLYDWVQYRITLSSSFFPFAPVCIESGHAFNPYYKQILELSRDPRRAGTVPVVSREEHERGKAAAVATKVPR